MLQTCKKISITDFTTLSLLGLCSNKNNLVLCQLWPRLIYNASPFTNLSAGVSFGNVMNASIGASHVISPTLSIGGEADYCHQTGRFKQNLVLNHAMSKTLIFTSQLSLVETPKIPNNVNSGISPSSEL